MLGWTSFHQLQRPGKVNPLNSPEIKLTARFDDRSRSGRLPETMGRLQTLI